MRRWTVGMVLLMVSLVAPRFEGKAQQALTKTSLIQQACMVSGQDCLRVGLGGIGKNASIQRVILMACLAEYTATRTAGAKARANRCMMAAVGVANALSITALAAGQSVLREKLAIPLENNEELASLVRSRLLAIPDACGRIKHLYTKYNCLTKRLYKLESGH